jgi:hypothetical protein
MKIYDTCNATLSIQNFGKSWLAILEGSEQDIETLFRGLYNFGGVGPTAALSYINGCRTTATVWTSQKRILNFFYTRFILRFMHGDTSRAKGKKGGISDEAKAYAEKEVEKLMATSQVTWYYNESAISFNHLYEMGNSIVAEKPDNNFTESMSETVTGDQRENVEKPLA